MNTLFKFFVQVWVLWGVGAAIALPRLWAGWRSRSDENRASAGRNVGGLAWKSAALLLVLASSTYLLLGTPARLDMRMVGWRPPFGTLNAFAYMGAGTYTWPDERHVIELRYDQEAIRWLLDHVRGNVVIVETAEVDYYRAGSTRVASLTGLSGLRGMHESEQRYGTQLAEREALHREFWATTEPSRTQQILNELGVGLVYAGQLEQYLHPDGVEKLRRMAEQGLLSEVFRNDRVRIYAVPGRLSQRADGSYVPAVGGESGLEGSLQWGSRQGEAPVAAQVLTLVP